MDKTNISKRIKNTLIASCQSSEGNPLFTKEHMLLLAECSHVPGCSGYRIDSPEHIRYIRNRIRDRLVIGTWKKAYPGYEVIITPTMEEVDAVMGEHVDIIAIDGTFRPAPGTENGAQRIAAVRNAYPDAVIMADISTCEEALEACRAGADLVATTLRGYTAETENQSDEEIDLTFIREVKSRISCGLIAEGKIWTREQARAALQNGADAVVVGTALNNPKLITERFVNFLEDL